MIARWWRGWREKRVLRRRPIPDELWQRTIERYPFLARRSVEDLAELRRLASLFLDQKEFTGVRGFEVRDDVALAVAAQACLPVLRLGLERYDGFVGVVMHADEVVARREVMDEQGIVHRYDEVLSGEAMEGGPVMLCWADVDGRDSDWAYNVVIHEFAHVLDLGDGVADGVPAGVPREPWLKVLLPEFDHFSQRVVCGHDTAMDPYGAEGPEEFFAVASETFFVAPDTLKEEQPALYRLLASFYRQAP